MKNKIDPRQLMLLMEYPSTCTCNNELFHTIEKIKPKKATILSFTNFKSLAEQNKHSCEVTKLLSAAQKLKW